MDVGYLLLTESLVNEMPSDMVLCLKQEQIYRATSTANKVGRT